MTGIRLAGVDWSLDEGNAEISIVFPLEPIVKAHEDPISILSPHDPEVIERVGVDKVAQVVTDEGVYVLDEDVDGRVADDVPTGVLPHHVLQ